MPRRYLRPGCPTDELRGDFELIRKQFEVAVDFPAEVESAAHTSAEAGPRTAEREDMTAVEFVTLDPPGSLDLDQAMHLERHGEGYRVLYAIADVGAIVERGSPVEREAWTRGVTVYCPDVRALLYPASISEGAASLLPDETRAAIVFTIDLDAKGGRTAAAVRRATVRSRAKLTYQDAEIPHLEEIGRLRQRLARERGAVRLGAPAQQVVRDGSSPTGYRLELEPRAPAEDWNAEISLLAGTAAAAMMIERRLGLLRTMGGTDPYRVEQLRRTAAALGVEWPAGEDYDDFVSRLDPGKAAEAALLEEARGVMGHAGYTFFEGDPGSETVHAGIAAHYAHTTAPLRRLQDRYVLDLLVGDGDRRALEALPETMEETASRAAAVERAVIDAAEIRLLEQRVGDRFTAVPLHHDRRGTVIQLTDPPVRARLHDTPAPDLGRAIQVQLARADPRSRSLEFHAVEPASSAPA
jgi:exoribonuclease R